LLAAALPCAAQTGRLKTRIQRDSSNHTTIVIHDTRPEAYARQRDAADRAQAAREAELQRRHEVELARIEADARVRVARAQYAPARPAPAQVVVRHEERKPSYRNGGQFTGFSNSFFLGGYGYGYGYGGYPYAGGGYGYRGYCAPRACAPAYRPCAVSYRRCR
jgi:hypothetical protein